MLKIQNNFENYKEAFKKDTGLDWQENLELYIKYYHAVVQDKTYQVLGGILNLLGQKPKK
jgi:hypothetical protein